jgi:uncharacterized protein Veg
MELEEQTKLIDEIRAKFEDNLGETIHVEQDLGRSRVSANTGIIHSVHPKLFVLEVTRKRGPEARLSYQFSDVLTGVVVASKDGENMFIDYQELLAVKKEPYDESLYVGNDFDDERILS